MIEITMIISREYRVGFDPLFPDRNMMPRIVQIRTMADNGLDVDMVLGMCRKA